MWMRWRDAVGSTMGTGVTIALKITVNDATPTYLQDTQVHCNKRCNRPKTVTYKIFDTSPPSFFTHPD